jgi:hypothetical protein
MPPSLCAVVVALVALGPASAGCSRPAPSASLPGDASSGLVALSIRVPAALTVARAIDTLSVAVDPESLGTMQVTASAGAVLGVEARTRVFAQGSDRPLLEHRTVDSRTDFAACSHAWSIRDDGLPVEGTKYVVEVQILLFETAVPDTGAREWDPHAAGFKSLWTRTLRQAEE